MGKRRHLKKINKYAAEILREIKVPVLINKDSYMYFILLHEKFTSLILVHFINILFVLSKLSNQN